MMLIALFRRCAGHVSLTRTAPDAHSPPMPMPRIERQMSSCITVCDVAAPSEAREKMRIVPISARVRPNRSATYPKIAPPTPDITSVAVPSMPAVSSPKPK
jgi:hypothetical protein